MDLIQAWEKAKEGDVIKLKSHIQMGKTADDAKILIVKGFNEEFLMSDDWEIERKPLVWEGEVKWQETPIAVVPRGALKPNNEKFTFPWQELIGKRTKIRIEEILDREE